MIKVKKKNSSIVSGIFFKVFYRASLYNERKKRIRRTDGEESIRQIVLFSSSLFIPPDPLRALTRFHPQRVTLLFFALTLANQRERNPLAYFPAGSPALFTHVLVKEEREKERRERKEKSWRIMRKRNCGCIFRRFVTREGEEGRGMENVPLILGGKKGGRKGNIYYRLKGIGKTRGCVERV